MMKLLATAMYMRGRPWLAYPAALAYYLIAFTIHWEAEEHGFPFVTFIPAVMLATLTGGVVPGFITAVVSGLTAWYFFLPPYGSFQLAWPFGYVAMTLYALTITISITVIETMYRALTQFQTERALTATMFAELQHRVANNLQFIASMLSIQKRSLQNDPSLAPSVLEEASQRLMTMARIHRRLYNPGSAAFELRQLVEELSRDLIRATGAHNVVCMIEIPEVGWDPDRLITVALLVTELMTNSLKHAFGKNEGGRIRISLTKTDLNRFELTVADDGKGLPADFDIDAAKGLGMQIVKGLVTQVGGTLEMINNNGTVTRVLIPA